MPPRDPSKVQLDFPDLVADLISDLNLRGTVGLMDFVDSMQPVYVAGSREGALSLANLQPTFTTAEIFADQTGSPAANAVLADTGALVAGTYDVYAMASWGYSPAVSAGPIFDFQHRNAADAVTLARVPYASLVAVADGQHDNLSFTYATVVAENERLRWQLLLGAAVGPTSTVIMASRRTAP